MSDFVLREETPKEAFAHLDDYHVIDVRFDFELHGPLGTIAGAERMERADLEARAEQLKRRPLLLVCRSGRRSAVACEALAALGVDEATNLEGGMIAWNDAGLPVVRPPSRSLEEVADGLSRWVGMVTQTPADRVRHDLGLDDAAPLSHSRLEAALAAVEGRMAGQNAPPDLGASIGVLRADLEALSRGPGASGGGSEAG